MKRQIAASTRTQLRRAKKQRSRGSKNSVFSTLGASLVIAAIFYGGYLLSQEPSPQSPTPKSLPSTATLTPISAVAPQGQSPEPAGGDLEAFHNIEKGDLLPLSRLCVMEMRGMSAPYRDDACLSAISTVLTRAERRFLSDGTISSTLSWHSGPTWQFAGYLVDGCRADMPAELCPDSYPELIDHFKALIKNPFRPTCNGYLFYNSIPGGYRDCVIEDSNTGQWIEFYGKSITPTSQPASPLQKEKPLSQ